MRNLILTLVLCTITSGTFAQDSKRESVEELLVLMNADASIDMMYSHMEKMFAGMSQQMGIQDSERADFEKFMTKVVKLMKDEMNWDKMKEPMVDVYLKHYTESEIQDMLTFYKSETGQSMIAKMPAVTADSMVLSQQMLAGFMPKLKKMAMEFQTERQAKLPKDHP